MSEELTPDERAANGAALLDRKFPGWERRVDLGRLDMSSGVPLSDTSGGACIVCQVTGCIFDHGVDVLDLDYDGELYRLGFLAPDGGYPELDEAWVQLLKERWATGALSDAVEGEGE